MRLLIVEDEEKTSSYVHRGLSELGYIVDCASTTWKSTCKHAK